MDPKPGKGDDVTFLNSVFFAFLIVARQKECHFWNPETKLDKIGMFVKEFLGFEIWLF